MIPDEPLPSPSGKRYDQDGLYYNFFPQARYGLRSWGDFFSLRQSVALGVIARHIKVLGGELPALLLALGKLADLANTVSPWEPMAECPRNVLGNGRVKPSWSFAEGVPISDSAGSFAKCLANLCAGIEASVTGDSPAVIRQAPAQHSPLSHESAAIWFTDPPYYDAIPYASLADAFWVWIKRASSSAFVTGLTTDKNGLCPKEAEIIADLELLRGHKKEHATRDGIPAKDKDYFEENMTRYPHRVCK
jgi:adenine-specific DNA methylase